MNLAKALKVKKNLIGDIAKLKQQISRKNSYLIGSKNGEKFQKKETFDLLMEKIQLLTDLKYSINEANKEIQAQIYMLAEYKALIAFWQSVNVTEGSVESRGYGNAGTVMEYAVHFNEQKRDEIVENFQKKVDALQDEIDYYNFTTEINWGEKAPVGDDELIKAGQLKKEEE